MTDRPPSLVADADADARIGVAWRELRRGASMQAWRELLLGTGPEALDQGQLDTLDLLVQNGPVRMGELADALRVDASTATRAVARLEADGLADRSRSSDDARVIVVRVTEAGQALQQRLYQRRVVFVRRVLAVFDEDELQQFASLLERMVAALDDVVASEATRAPGTE